MIGAKFDPDHAQYGVVFYPNAGTWYNIFYLHTKFGDSHFSHSGDMTAGIENENGSCDHDPHNPNGLG